MLKISKRSQWLSSSIFPITQSLLSFIFLVIMVRLAEPSEQQAILYCLLVFQLSSSFTDQAEDLVYLNRKNEFDQYSLITAKIIKILAINTIALIPLLFWKGADYLFLYLPICIAHLLSSLFFQSYFLSDLKRYPLSVILFARVLSLTLLGICLIYPSVLIYGYASIICGPSIILIFQRKFDFQFLDFNKGVSALKKNLSLTSGFVGSSISTTFFGLVLAETLEPMTLALFFLIERFRSFFLTPVNILARSLLAVSYRGTDQQVRSQLFRVISATIIMGTAFFLFGQSFIFLFFKVSVTWYEWSIVSLLTTLSAFNVWVNFVLNSVTGDHNLITRAYWFSSILLLLAVLIFNVETLIFSYMLLLTHQILVTFLSLKLKLN